MSTFKAKNNDTFQELLEFYKFFDDKIKPYGLDIYLYGSLSYLYFTWDENIIVWDIDLITKEDNYEKIIKLFKDYKDVEIELTKYNSVRLLKNDLKISIHSQEKSKEIIDITKNIQEIKINWVIFKSLCLYDLIKFYNFSILLKEWYQEKLDNLLRVYYWDNYSFFLLKPSVLENNKIYEIEKYIEKNWIEIIERKEITLDEKDIDYLYKEEYEEFLSSEDIEKALDINKKMYKNKKVIFLLVKRDDAIKKADYLKWDSYWPKACREDSIRYIFRDEKYDDFDFIKWKIVEVPCDNIVHCPKNFYEFKKAVTKWFI